MQSEGLPSSGDRLVAIVSKPAKPELATIVPELVEWLQRRGYGVIGDLETGPFTKAIKTFPRSDLGSHPLRFIIVLGGDGTLLSASRVVAQAGIPVLGINLGSLGFLTEISLEEMYSTLDAIDKGCCGVEERSMVHCEVFRDEESIAQFDALNDVVVGKSTIARLNHCDVYVDGVFVSAYRADSVIVSTPTGSTAYALAAGGPIVMPSVHALLITPVSAHSLTHRPLVVRDTAEIELVVNTGSEEAYLSIDGQIGMPVYDKDRIRCSKSESTVRLLRVKKTFFDVLRGKLKWGQR